MSRRLSSLPPFAYRGVEAPNPPKILYMNKSPVNPYDWHGMNLGDFWVVQYPHELWYLASLEGNRTQSSRMATWIKLYPYSGPTGGGAEDFVTDEGTATQDAGVLNIIGGTNIHTTGTGNTVTISVTDSIGLSGDLTVTGPIIFPSITNGIVQADNVGDLSASRGTDGQLLIGKTGGAPSWAHLTPADASVFITEGPGTIDLIAVGEGGGITTMETDDGDAYEVASAIQILGGSNVSTAGSGNTVTIALNNSIALNNGLSLDGDLMFTNSTEGVLEGDADGVISASQGTDGQLLVGYTGNNPVWGNITSTDGTITITKGPGTINLAASNGIGDFLFSAYKSTPTIVPVMLPADVLKDHLIIYDTVLIDEGSNYNSTTGVFTVPDKGIYYFYVSVSPLLRNLTPLLDVSPLGIAVALLINSEGVETYNEIYSSGVYDIDVHVPYLAVPKRNLRILSGSVILSLKKNDTLKALFYNGPTETVGNSYFEIRGEVDSFETSMCGYRMR